MPELEHLVAALVHDVAYESILLQQRRDLHRLVATTFEREYADRLDDFFSVLALQFANAVSGRKLASACRGGRPGSPDRR